MSLRETIKRVLREELNSNSESIGGKPSVEIKKINRFISIDDNFYKSILKGIGAPITDENMNFMYAWRQSEGGEAKNNPFNTTYHKPGATFYNCLSKNSEGKCINGVKNYQEDLDGIQATIDTLKNGKYDKIINSLKLGDDSIRTSIELKNSPWGTGDLTMKVLKGYKSGSIPNPPKIA